LVPGALIDALSVVGGMLPAVGIGLLLRGIGRPRLIPYFVIGFTLAVYLDLPVLVIALLAAAVAWLTVGGARPVDGVSDRSGAERAPEARVPRRVLWGSWVRWVMFLHASYNYERLQGLGFAHTMKPVIEYLYRTPAARAAALQRHLVLFNTEPQFGALVPAAVIALEEQRAADGAIPDDMIAAVKSGLMGPLAGIGDSMIQGLLTPLLLSMGIALAQRGSLAGPVLYALLISAIVLGSSYTFWSLGYRWGRAAVRRILSSGWVQALGEAAAIVGMAVTGALTATIVRLSTTASIAVGEVVISLQSDVLDAVLRGLLPLSLTLLAWWLLSRRIPSMRVIAILFVLGIDLAYLGLAGSAAPPLLSRAWWTWLLGGALAHLWPPLLASGLAAGAWIWRRRKGKDARSGEES
jgi:PTS system mannose-specific IID component